jgi:homoaconitase
MRAYLQATGREDVMVGADWAAAQGALAADPGAEYDQVVEIVCTFHEMPPMSVSHHLQDLSSLEPSLNGPFTPDLSTPISSMAQVIEDKGWKDAVSAALIGSCTNSSYEDMVRHIFASHCTLFIATPDKRCGSSTSS